jgi:hypothetical protein
VQEHLIKKLNVTEEKEKESKDTTSGLVDINKLRLFWERNATLELKS